MRDSCGADLVVPDRSYLRVLVVNGRCVLKERFVSVFGCVLARWLTDNLEVIYLHVVSVPCVLL